MVKETPPAEIEALAQRRAEARRARDWEAADRLRAEIEAAGWRVVDAATLWSLERGHAPTVEESGITRYGSSAAVPSRLEDAPVGLVSVVMVAAGERTSEVARVAGSLAEHAPDGTQLVVVANAPSSDEARVLEALDRTDPGAPGVLTEVVWTSERLGHGAALNAGIRRASSAVVVILDPGIEPQGDILTPLVRALDDPAVAIAGAFGLVSADMRRFTEAAAGAVEVDAVEGVLQAFRRADFAERGPLDEHFIAEPYLDVWWSLVLRDAEEPPARRAVVVPGLPLTRSQDRGQAAGTDERAERQSRRNFYRMLKSFATRRDLLGRGGPPEG